MNNKVEQDFITPPSSPGRREREELRAQLEGSWAPVVGAVANQRRSARIEELINQRIGNIMPAASVQTAPVQPPANIARTVSGEFSSAGSLSFFSENLPPIEEDELMSEDELISEDESSEFGITF